MHPLRSILPLALFTAVGLLATDLYLPAVPSLPQQLGGSIESAQATLAAFSAALAVSQLVWGAAADRFGHRRTLAFAVLLQLVAGAACALAPSMGALIGARLAQGFGVGAAMVIVPALVRQSFGDGGAVRALAWLGIVESAVPGLAPLVGAALLVVADWRTSFWIIVALSAIAAPLVFRVIPTARAMRACAPANVGAHAGGYRRLLRSPVYLGYALGHALCFAALLAFVASAPQVVEIWLGAGPSTFSLMQACGVAAFMLLAYADWRSTPLVVASWMLFCGSLGLRGPASMARALAAEPAVAGRAAGLLMFFGLGGAALATQAVAPFLRLGLAPVAWMCAGFTLASGAVVLWGIAIRGRHRAAATEIA